MSSRSEVFEAQVAQVAILLAAQHVLEAERLTRETVKDLPKRVPESCRGDLLPALRMGLEPLLDEVFPDLFGELLAIARARNPDQIIAPSREVAECP